jgi:phosphatidate cytidylyltransferase
MNLTFDRETSMLAGGVIAVLIFASLIGWILGRRPGNAGYQATIANLNARTRAWWLMVAVFFLAMLSGGIGSVILFGLTSFLALREFVTMTPTKPGDHDTLLWLFFVITPIQYGLVAIGWYGLFAIFIPVYAFLFVPLRSVLSGDCERFLERTATMQWALMICVYCVSHVPALLTLGIPGFEGKNGGLLFYFVLVVQVSDVLQYIWGKLFGNHKIAPTVSPNKTWEGFLGGVATATLVGSALWWATPFTPWQAVGMSLAITLMGFAGGLVMSAIKRDRGVKDYGTLIQGHGGVMDRIDSLCFSAPVFFHLTRYFFT